MYDFDLDQDAGIDLTPLIDVIFMLLIFFIMTTTFSKPVLDIVLPASDAATPQSERKPELIVTITAEGKIYHHEQEMDKEALAILLDSREDELLNVHVDEKAPFEAFVSVVDIAKTKRGGHFVISTQPSAGNKPVD